MIIPLAVGRVKEKKDRLERFRPSFGTGIGCLSCLTTSREMAIAPPRACKSVHRNDWVPL